MGARADGAPLGNGSGFNIKYPGFVVSPGHLRDRLCRSKSHHHAALLFCVSRVLPELQSRGRRARGITAETFQPNLQGYETLRSAATWTHFQTLKVSYELVQEPREKPAAETTSSGFQFGDFDQRSLKSV